MLAEPICSHPTMYTAENIACCCVVAYNHNHRLVFLLPDIFIVQIEESLRVVSDHLSLVIHIVWTQIRFQQFIINLLISLLELLANCTMLLIISSGVRYPDL